MRKRYTRRTRLIHLFALDRNELRRWSDRIEAWFLLGLMMTFVPLATVAAISAARWVQADGARELGAELRLRQVNAVLVRDAPAEDAFGPAPISRLVQARWTAGGMLHTGAVPVIPGTQAGNHVRIWVNAAGKAQEPPLTSSQLSARVVMAAAGAPLAVAVGMLLAWSGLRWLLDRRRLAAWGASWSMVGRSWTR